ncbi:MAG: hypothetical protein KC483_10800 [Nitrosarchaeum sp.]|nr:hypothetical protein [Nitrosarchaeum sp.]
MAEDDQPILMIPPKVMNDFYKMKTAMDRINFIKNLCNNLEYRDYQGAENE